MESPAAWNGRRIFTVGHSTRSADEFATVLRSFGITNVADIRTIPRSRRHPHFSGPQLAADLARTNVAYLHIAELGGLRRPRADSPNMAWRNTGFRGYADHMLTDAFEEGLARLAELAGTGVTAVMCAEAVPWRCHRSLLADTLVVRGAQVEHITAPSRSHPHTLSPIARVQGLALSYPLTGAAR
jgi:uncharacterized protein (DUF488 family)